MKGSEGWDRPSVLPLLAFLAFENTGSRVAPGRGSPPSPGFPLEGHGGAGFSRVGLLLGAGAEPWGFTVRSMKGAGLGRPVPHNSVLRCLGDKGVGGLPAAKGFRCRERPGLPVCPPSLHTCPGSPGATVHITHIPHFLAMEMGSFLGMFNAGNKALVLRAGS